MANNRLYLYDPVSGDRFMLAKSFSESWHIKTPVTFAAELEAWLKDKDWGAAYGGTGSTSLQLLAEGDLPKNKEAPLGVMDRMFTKQEMKIKLILLYLHDRGGLDLVNQAFRDKGKFPDHPFALDEVYIVMSEEQVKKYVPDFTPDKYREWYKERRPSWSDEQIDSELFE